MMCFQFRFSVINEHCFTKQMIVDTTAVSNIKRLKENLALANYLHGFLNIFLQSLLLFRHLRLSILAVLPVPFCPVTLLIPTVV